MPLVFGGNTSDGCCGDSFWVKDDPSNEVAVLFLLSRDVPLSRYEDSLFRIIGSEYYGELGVVDPSAFPVYLGLRSSEPWISEGGFLFPNFGKVEPEVCFITSFFNFTFHVLPH